LLCAKEQQRIKIVDIFDHPWVRNQERSLHNFANKKDDKCAKTFDETITKETNQAKSEKIVCNTANEIKTDKKEENKKNENPTSLNFHKELIKEKAKIEPAVGDSINLSSLINKTESDTLFEQVLSNVKRRNISK
jgi:hypothetical protein